MKTLWGGDIPNTFWEYQREVYKGMERLRVRVADNELRKETGSDSCF